MLPSVPPHFQWLRGKQNLINRKNTLDQILFQCNTDLKYLTASIPGPSSIATLWKWEKGTSGTFLVFLMASFAWTMLLTTFEPFIPWDLVTGHKYVLVKETTARLANWFEWISVCAKQPTHSPTRGQEGSSDFSCTFQPQQQVTVGSSYQHCY